MSEKESKKKLFMALYGPVHDRFERFCRARRNRFAFRVRRIAHIASTVHPCDLLVRPKSSLFFPTTGLPRGGALRMCEVESHEVSLATDRSIRRHLCRKLE